MMVYRNIYSQNPLSLKAEDDTHTHTNTRKPDAKEREAKHVLQQLKTQDGDGKLTETGRKGTQGKGYTRNFGITVKPSQP